MRNRLRLRLEQLYVIEAALVGVFFVSALRYLIGMVYSRVGGASILQGLETSVVPVDMPGVVSVATVTNEIAFLVYMLALPLLTLVFGRVRLLIIVAAGLVAAGRALMVAGTTVTPLTGTAMAVGGGLLYLALIVRHRMHVIPYLFVLGFAVDQVFRAVGNTLDPSWSPAYLNIQVVLSLILVLLSVFTVAQQGRKTRNADNTATPERGLMPLWGGVGLSGLLFLELSLLSLPNAIAGRADIDYTIFAPFVTLATVLPLIPWVRKQARSFVGLFDGSVRGWAWMLLIALLIVFGTRFQGIAAGVALVVAQFAVSLLWWWLVRPQAEKERNIGGLWLVAGMLVFLLLVVADNFTYEYAYIRNLAPELNFLNDIVPPFLRGFRGMGLGLLLVSVFLAVLPMVQTPRRVPWTGGTNLTSAFGLLVALGFSVGVAYAVRPPVIQAVVDTPQNPVQTLRVGTYNIHGGFNEFYHYDLEAIARTIQRSGANVVLLQQTESGRLTSFGVDQSLWLARRLGMDRRFYPTNEGLQGLAVLSNVPIVYDDGSLLTSVGSQTGLQRVQIRPDAGIITLYNTWLGFLLDTGDGRSLEEQEQDQQRQLTEVFALINQHYPGEKGRLILGGTFNNIPSSPLITQLRQAGFRDPFAGAPLEISATFQRVNYPPTRLDYLWLLSPLSECGTGVIDSAASDHRLAFVEVLITPQGRCPG